MITRFLLKKFIDSVALFLIAARTRLWEVRHELATNPRKDVGCYFGVWEKMYTH